MFAKITTEKLFFQDNAGHAHAYHTASLRVVQSPYTPPLIAMEKIYHYRFPITLLLLVFVLAGSVYLFFLLKETTMNASIEEQYLTDSLKKETENRKVAEARIVELEGVLSETQALLQDTLRTKDDLSMNLLEEQERNDAFEEQIEKIDSTVGVLDKLAKTDPELLMKYSKVYFLNEHYMPEALVMIDDAYLYSEGGDPKFFHKKVYPFLTEMIDDALEDDVQIWITSAFRSFDTQRALKGAYTVNYGSGANTFAADQGFSEHQLGTTVDLTTSGLGGGIDGFENTPAYAWLQKNAYKYGFVLSYTEGNAYYIFEPWHWRFVGTELAEELHDTNTHFYDMDQREIDTYLISFFD
jgi:zinc D-Ala-D-Ala carboxypeptidase